MDKKELDVFPNQGRIYGEKITKEELVSGLRKDNALAVGSNYGRDAQLKRKEDIANGKAAILRAAAKRSMAKARRRKIVKITAGVVGGVALAVAIAWQGSINQAVDITNGIKRNKDGAFHSDGTPVEMFELWDQYLNPTDEQKDLATKILLQQPLDDEYDDYYGNVDEHSRGGRI